MRERFGSKAFRVFRLLLLKRLLDQKQVSDMAMVPSKEAKELLYTLLAERFVTLQVISAYHSPHPYHLKDTFLSCWLVIVKPNTIMSQHILYQIGLSINMLFHGMLVRE